MMYGNYGRGHIGLRFFPADVIILTIHERKEHFMQEYISLKIISNEANAPTVARFIADTVKPLGFSERRAHLICFAVESVLDVRMRQITSDNPFVEISVSQNAEYVIISIRDKGLPYILTENQRLILSHGLAENYRLEQLASDGQRLLLMLRPETENVFELPHMEGETLADAEITAQKLRPTDEDINEAIRCMYSAYGYEYLHQAMYKIGHFRELVEEGSFHATLAKNAHGQVLGMGALVKDQDFPGLYEVSNLATKTYARGHGVAKLLFREALREADGLDAEGIYCCPVAFHTATQKICEAVGMTPCGFILQGFPPNAAGGFRDGNRRLDYALCANITNKQKHHTLYLAEKIRGIVTEFFDTEKLRYTVEESAEIPQETRMDVGVDAFTSTASVVADQCGADFESRIAGLLQDREVIASEMIMLFLNVNEKGAVHGYEVLKKHGFLFMGSLPGSLNGDYIIMQQLRGEAFRRDKIKLTPTYAAWLDRIMAVNEDSD